MVTYRRSLLVDLNESSIERSEVPCPTRLDRQSNIVEDGRCGSRGIGKLDPIEFDLASKVEFFSTRRCIVNGWCAIEQVKETLRSRDRRTDLFTPTHRRD